MPAAGALRIGAVLRALSTEFPEVSASKLRFLESAGLVTPGRAPSGYRLYAAADVERITFALRAQRDHFWPLRVIAAALDARDRGLEVDPLTMKAHAPPSPARVEQADRPRPALRLHPDELSAASGLGAEQREQARRSGLLPTTEHFGARDVEIAEALAGLAAYGIDVRHLRPVRSLVDRELALIEGALVGYRAGEKAQSHEELVRLLSRLHSALLESPPRG